MYDGNIRIEPILVDLPSGFDTLRAEALAEGHRFLERLASDWASGAIRFECEGEALLAVRSNAVLAAIGGLTIEPVAPGALRMRRFYVSAAFRRSGVGRGLATALLERARRHTTLVTCNAGIGSVPFWRSLGFVADARDGHTHVLDLGQHLAVLPVVLG